MASLKLTPTEYLYVLAQRAGVEIDQTIIAAFKDHRPKHCGIVDEIAHAPGFYTPQKLQNMQREYDAFFKVVYSIDGYLFAPNTSLANSPLLEKDSAGITDVIIGNVPLMIAHLNEVIRCYYDDKGENSGDVTVDNKMVFDSERLYNAATMLIPMLKLLSVSAQMTRLQGTNDEDEWITRDCFESFKWFVFGRGDDSCPDLPKVTRMF